MSLDSRGAKPHLAIVVQPPIRPSIHRAETCADTLTRRYPLFQVEHFHAKTLRLKSSRGAGPGLLPSKFLTIDETAAAKMHTASRTLREPMPASLMLPTVNVCRAHAPGTPAKDRQDTASSTQPVAVGASWMPTYSNRERAAYLYLIPSFAADLREPRAHF